MNGTDREFAGSAFVVTGAASGIGRAISLRLALAGAEIIAVDRDAAGLEQLERDLCGNGNSIVPQLLDLAALSDIAALDRFLAARKGPGLRGAVNCAALVVPCPVVEQEAAAWDETFAVNLRAPLLITQLAVRHRDLGAPAGIVHISSTAAAIARSGHAAYAASKAALEQLARVQAIEFAAVGIRVNAIRVGLVDTEGVRLAAAGEAGLAEHRAKIARIPLKREGRPQEIAEMAAFLLSHRSSFCTGGIYTVDGGYTAG